MPDLELATWNVSGEEVLFNSKMTFRGSLGDDVHRQSCTPGGCWFNLEAIFRISEFNNSPETRFEPIPDVYNKVKNFSNNPILVYLEQGWSLQFF